MYDVKNCRQPRHLIFTAFLFVASSSAFADRLHHVDGTVVEGKVLNETPDNVLIETKYGKLNYDRRDLVRVERSATASTATTGTVSAAPVNLMKHVPQGPINPFAPPQIPYLVTLAPKPAAPAPTPQR